MNKRMYCMHDSASGVYSPPFCHVSDGEATRAFSDAFQQVEVMKNHPEHFTLFYVGVFDDARCKFDIEEPISLMRGVDVRVDNVRELKVGGTD